jgi:hypothetical protein
LPALRKEIAAAAQKAAAAIQTMLGIQVCSRNPGRRNIADLP